MDAATTYDASSAAVSVYSCRPDSEFYKSVSRRTSSIGISRRTSSVGDTFQELESTGEVITRFELDIACVCEKMANLNLLLMHVEAMESDFEAFVSDINPNPSDLYFMALEFDFLSGFLNSEVRVLETHISDLQMDKATMQEFLSSCKYLGEPSMEMEDMLCDSEKSLRQSLDQLLEIKARSAMFEKNLLRFAGEETCPNKDSAGFSHNNDLPELKDKMNMQTVEHQRHILRMLEKSLERELEFEKRVTESTQIEEALTMRLHSSLQEVLYAEEETEMTLEKFYEADHTSEILTGISKELLSKIMMLHFNLERSGFELKETAETLKAKESASLKSEKRTTDSEVQLASGKTSMEMENTIKDLKEQILKAERRAENAEAKSKLLTETSKELKGTSEKVVLLEKELRDAKIKLQLCKSRKDSFDEMESMVVMMVGVAEDFYSNPRFY